VTASWKWASRSSNDSQRDILTGMYDAMVLAGGTGRRLGGVDKPGLLVGGRSLLDRVLDATADAATTVVVGPSRPTSRSVLWTRESPVGGGPVAALQAGLAHITSARVVLLAADLPFLSRFVVAGLGAGRNTVVSVDGRPQWLCGGWDTADLRQALQGVEVQGARLSDVLQPLKPDWMTLLDVPGRPPAWQDVDTAEDLLHVRSLA
jgi:molybdopterin-guanine dinucleotide biosynthesis protein A